ncbi:MAG: hypothetical protein EOM05_00345 [Clostridia bacterium]|nr:hypothetical protein [Clostridia bacterium]
MPFLTGKAEVYFDSDHMRTLMNGFSVYPKQILKSLKPKTRKDILSDEDKMFKEISLYGIDFSGNKSVEILKIDVLGITVVLEASFGYSSNAIANYVFTSKGLGVDFNDQNGFGVSNGYAYTSITVKSGGNYTNTYIAGIYTRNTLF